MVWVEHSSNFFLRRLYSLQKSFLFISSYGQLAAPQLLRTWGCYTWEGDTHRSSCCARKAGTDNSTTHSQGRELLPGPDVTLRGQGLTTQPHPLATSCSQPHPQCHHSPECMWVLSPCLSCISQHYQQPHQLWQTAWYQCCPNSQMQPWQWEKQEKQRRCLKKPWVSSQLRHTLTVQAEITPPSYPRVKCKHNSLSPTDK